MYRHRPRRTALSHALAHALSLTTMDNLPVLLPALQAHQNVVANPNVFSDQTIFAPNLPSFLTRSINMTWYYRVEESEPNAQPGDRFLVNRYVSTIRGNIIVQDFITTRCADQNNIYQGWSHQTVAYLQGDNSPYPFHFDRR